MPAWPPASCSGLPQQLRPLHFWLWKQTPRPASPQLPVPCVSYFCRPCFSCRKVVLRIQIPAAAQQKPESSSRLPAPTPPPSLLHPGSTAGALAQLAGFIRLRLLALWIERHVCCRAPLVAKFLVIELPDSQWSRKKRVKTQTRRRKVSQALRLTHF